MRSIVVLMLVILSTSTAWAMTCDEFVARAQKADTADYLPDLEVKQVPSLPDGFREVTNLRNIQTGLECRDGTFAGFGASLIETTKPDLMRWSALAAASLNAIGESKGIQMTKESLKKAVAAAERNQIKSGVASGVSEREIGDYTFEYGFIAPDGHSFQIYLTNE